MRLRQKDHPVSITGISECRISRPDKGLYLYPEKVALRNTHFRKYLCYFFIFILLCVSLYGYVEEWGNFHVVSEGQLYRSSQMDADELLYYIKRYRIKSILNLRGPNPAAPWYQEELAIANKTGAAHYDYPLSATRVISDRDIHRVLTLIRQAPKPLLIHCQGGADRTGVIAALWEYSIAGKDAQEAAKQLSLFYGHFPFLWSRTKAMDETFWHYVAKHENEKKEMVGRGQM